MQFGLRVQDIIGLILAVLIVAILIGIILILRESARERRLWREEYGEEESEKSSVRKVTFPRGKERRGEEPLEVQEKPRTPWRKEAEEEKVEPVPPEEVESITLSEVRKEEPKQVVLERALRKLEDLGVDFHALKPVFGEDVVHFSPLLWEVKEEVRSGRELGDIVIHTVFKSLPGYSPDEIVERYRSGDVSVVEKLEARVKTREGRDFLVATMNLTHFQVPELERHFRLGNLREDEYELLRALKFVDRTTKKDFARMVYARIMDED
ncbi:hypothetical protein [Candidatus Caldatribacterium sp.]|uniref:hypothetical protein n=1 Tax=Candidatus Caldatribacterium sp. TaxID=2282143 RepID=UPI00384239F3|nr:hypothetical protein [Candidatus Caldatribacterium sp.]